jgi:hypothetical protein
LNLENQELEDLGDVLRQFEHLRDINLSKNALKEVHQIASVPYLLNFNGSHNQVETIDFLSHEYDNLLFIRNLKLDHNKIQLLPEVPQPNLKDIDLSHN